FREGDRIPRLLQTFLARDLQLVLEMDVGGGEKDMDPGTRSMLQSLPCTLDVLTTRTGQASNDRPADRRGDRSHGFKIAVRSDGKSGFNDIHAEAIQLPRKAQLFFHIHAAAGGLLAVSQGGIKDSYACAFHAQTSMSGKAFIVRRQPRK